MPDFKAYAVSRLNAPQEPLSSYPSPIGRKEVEIKVTHCGIRHFHLSMPQTWAFGLGSIGAAIAKRRAADGASVAITYTKGADTAASVVKEIEDAGRQAIAIQ